MSVVLVCLPSAPKISEEAVKKEEELDKYLETRVEGQHTEHIHMHIFTMMKFSRAQFVYSKIRVIETCV